jgi:predicted PurR-regulated permease PerM
MFSIFLAMLMTPASNIFERWGMSRVFSTLTSVFIIIIAILLVLGLISIQVASFADDLPTIQKKLENLINTTQDWVKSSFGVSNDQQITALKDQLKNLMSNAGSFIKNFVIGMISLIGSSALVLVLTFLFLLSRDKYENFFVMFHKDEKSDEVKEVIHKISGIAQQYLVGRFISIIFLAVLYFIGLLILGIKNAFLLSAIAALVTFIPYVGPIIGGLLPVTMALLTEDSFGPAIGVVVVMAVAQVFDNYIITPLFIGGSVNISPFFTIFILIAGGLLWGIAGVILFIPLLGMIKIVFDNVEGLQPFAYLIGDQKKTTTTRDVWEIIKKKFKRKK